MKRLLNGLGKTNYKSNSYLVYERRLNMEVSRMITMSTGHISEETNKMLGDTHIVLPISVYDKTDVGWFIYLPTDKTEDARILKELPKDLAMIFMFARHHMFDIVCLDCDGSDIDELPIYDW